MVEHAPPDRVESSHVSILCDDGCDVCSIRNNLHKIRTSQQNVAGRVLKEEKNFLIQTIPLSVLIAIEVVMFKFIPILGVTGHRRFIVVGIENLIIIANLVVSPVLLLTFNRDVQKMASDVFRSFH
ncbi:hypothetical protein KIN20_023528 [Parelaphostrongylus tenuis]|uniref:G-protein coupled receptors family 1 profile domain-containing protein n=1 Tax=Parelaphostrongylus tenuis TaxID=148309 RepID=A0AAD5MRW6_PARTN|nr:hypothetical protein KIN20_023528 [Parelaphostrongylus tenuis]